MAETYSIISITAFALFGVFLLLSILLGIKFNIPKIIGDLSGHTAKKSIDLMQEKNEKSVKQTFKPSIVNVSIGSPVDENRTDISGETQVLSNCTDVLGRTGELATQTAANFIVVKDIMLIHTKEVI